LASRLIDGGHPLLLRRIENIERLAQEDQIEFAGF
jgi:hypothetical protein